MARTRLINPAATHDEDVATMSIWARYVWAYLPCFADREGRLRDSAFTIKGQIFPAEEVDVEGVLAELETRRHVIRYEVGGRRFIQIRNFEKYQSPHKNESPSTIPPPSGVPNSSDAAPETLVYFIQNTTTGLIKIGASARPQHRLDTLQVGCHDRLRLIGLVRGGFSREGELHARFAADRKNGEWFAPADEILDFIELDSIHERLVTESRVSRESDGSTPSHPVSDLGSGEFPPPVCDPTAEEQAAAAPLAVPEAVASAVADARGVSLTQLVLLALWKRVRDEETGTNSGLGSGGFGIKPERIRDGYELVVGEAEGPIVVEQSMRRFWRSVKSGAHPKATECARQTGLAWGCWMADFPGDVLAARGAVPEIQKRDRAGPAGRDQPPPKAYATLNRRGP